jgi:hypothetical protein
MTTTGQEKPRTTEALHVCFRKGPLFIVGAAGMVLIGLLTRCC